MDERAVIDEILRREGGGQFTVDPDDAGGATRWGVTVSTLSSWRRRPCTAADVASLTEAEAREIYADLYIRRPGFDRVPDPLLRVALIDFGVHSGTATAVKALQRALGVAADGVIGPKTLAALSVADVRSARARLVAGRARLLGRLIADRPQNAKFAAGWMNRLGEFIEELAA